MFWANTDDDIQTKIKLQLGLEKAISTENLQAISLVVTAALGGKRKPKPIENWNQAQAAFANIMGGGIGSGKDFNGVDVTSGLEDVFKDIEEKSKDDNGKD